jgi:hypothetical protein
LSDADPVAHGLTIWNGTLWYCDDVGPICCLKSLHVYFLDTTSTESFLIWRSFVRYFPDHSPQFLLA